MLQPTLQSITSEIIHNPNPPTRSSLVAQRVKRLPAIQETWVRSLGQEDPLEKEMQPTLVKPHGQRSLVDYSPWDHKCMCICMGCTRLSNFTPHPLCAYPQHPSLNLLEHLLHIMQLPIYTWLILTQNISSLRAVPVVSVWLCRCC